MKKENMNFVFFGTGDFAVKILNILYQNNFAPALIATTPDKPKGRKMILTSPPVKIWAQEHKIKTITDYALPATRYDLFIVADYGKIIPKNILDIPEYGAINIHPSLLPKYRGPSPIQSFILSGEKETGVTIILLDEEMDHGPILAQQSLNLETGFPIGNPVSKLYYKELEEKLAELGGELLVKTIPNLIARKIKPIPQDHNKATYTKKITKKDGEINLNESPEIIERKIRAFTPWPGAYFSIPRPTSLARSGGILRIIITEAEIDKNGALKIKQIKPEGKKEMSFKDFLRGNRDIADQIPFLLNKKNIQERAYYSPKQ
ncbi:methionyl-tRNA formyltransferase [Patescibacteria group bacterium]|nr:methionyl-tRNA formyltransferase [Patescibacteria group bacterium]